MHSPEGRVSPTRKRRLVHLGTGALLGAVVMAAVLNVLKGVHSDVQELGIPYWTMTYHEGFIRRGFVGTLVHPFIANYDLATQRKAITTVHELLVAAFCAVLLAWSCGVVRRAPTARVRTMVLIGTATLFLSELPTTVIALVGYLDILLLLFCVTGAYLANRGHYLASGLLALIGPLIHDAFVFLWAPVILITARRILRAREEDRWRVARMATPLLLPMVTAVLVVSFHSVTAGLHMIERAPVSEAVKESFRLYQFGLSTRGAFEIMRGKYAAIPEQFLLALAFFLPAPAVIATAANAIDRDPIRWRRAAFTVSVTAAPCMVLLVAWDLSRFLQWTVLSAFLLLLSNAAEQTDEGVSHRSDEPYLSFKKIDIFAIVTLALLSTGPHVYAYFEVAFTEFSTIPSIASMTRRMPIARLTYGFVRLYNRHQYVHRYVSSETCTLEAPSSEHRESCTFILSSGQFAETKELWLEPGAYRATVRMSPIPVECAGPAMAAIRPNVFWPFGNSRPTTTFEVREPTSGTVTFTIDEEESALARVRLTASSISGCFRLDELRIE